LAIPERFDSVVDIGCFHSLYSDADRAAYAGELHRVCGTDAQIFLRAFSDPREGFAGMHSPRRSETEIRSAFEGAGGSTGMLEERDILLLISPQIQHQTWAWFAILLHK
jgi:hypothetical protein